MRRITLVAVGVLGAALLSGCGSDTGSTATQGPGGSGNRAGSVAAGSGGGSQASGGSAAGGAPGSTGAGGVPGAVSTAGTAGSDGPAAGNAGAANGGGAGATSGGPVDPFSTAPGGTITVASLYYTEAQPVLLIQPSLPYVSGAQGTTCTSTRYGDCVINDCTLGNANAARLSAGVITVDSAADQIHQFVTPDAQGAYSGTQGKFVFSGGEALTVSASGGDIPAFAVNTQFPLLLLVDNAPAASAATSVIPAPHTAPLSLSWERGAPGVFFAAQPFNVTGNVGAACYFDSQAGTGTVPAEVLSAFPAGQQFLLLTAIATAAEVGPPAVNVWVLGEALTLDKKAHVVLQVQ
jgi:hypothetical protein